VPRRLLLLVGVVVLVDTALYAALVPLLPRLEDEFGLSKAAAGLLVAAYPAGTFLGALPGGWLAARFGPRPVAIAGLALMTVSGAGFALAQSIVLLDAARFVQGIGGAMTWIAGLAWIGAAVGPGRRGEAIGFAIGAAVFGAQFGPVLGILAETIGRGPAFLAVAGLGVVLAALVWLQPAPDMGAQEDRPPRILLGDRVFQASVWIPFVTALAFGVIEVLLPLRFDDLGAGALAIGAAFLAAALVEAVISPLAGRHADRSGVRAVIRTGCLIAVVALGTLWWPAEPLVLSVLLVAFAVAAGLLFTPSGRVSSVRAEDLGVGQGWAFAFVNVAWSGGIALGALAGGALGGAVGDGVPYLACAALLLATAVATAGRRGGRPDAPVRFAP
jgi:predicted MFS family arabinose efflux permease